LQNKKRYSVKPGKSKATGEKGLNREIIFFFWVQIQHILNERDVLIKSKVNPYLVHLSYSFQDENYIYMAMVGATFLI
jgi:serine/threonine protein kinase